MAFEPRRYPRDFYVRENVVTPIGLKQFLDLVELGQILPRESAESEALVKSSQFNSGGGVVPSHTPPDLAHYPPDARDFKCIGKPYHVEITGEKLLGKTKNTWLALLEKCSEDLDRAFFQSRSYLVRTNPRTWLLAHPYALSRVGVVEGDFVRHIFFLKNTVRIEFFGKTNVYAYQTSLKAYRG